MLSYNGHLRIGVMSDTAVLTNPSIITDLFLAKLAALAKALNIE
jgi:hypothetical protein